MNTLLNKSTLAAAIALTVAACNTTTDSEGVAGIGGSGYVSSGSVSGFGSVYVNGVKFETDSSTFDVEGVSGTQDDLAIGMIVQVSGTINDDGVTGTATSISYDDQLQGPVTGLTAPDADGVTRSFTVLGTNVIIDSGSTSFDVSGDIVPPPNPAFGFDTIALNNNVEVNGFFDSSGNLKATRVELKDIVFDANSIVEIKGTISGLSGTTFNLGSLKVDASSASLDDLPNGLEDNIFVEVKGTFDIASNTLTASEVEAEDDSVEDTDEFELEGIITDYVDDSNFKIDGINVNASNATREPATLELADDVHVEAEGAIINGILVANEIESEGGNLKVHAMVTAVPPVTAANTFEVSPLSGQTITVTVSTDTQFEDDVDEDNFFNIDDLLTDDFVQVEGFEDSNGSFTAVEVDIKEPGDVIVQGELQAFTADASIQVLGVTYTVDYNAGAGETDFEGSSDTPITQAEFESAAPIGTIVKIKDEDDNGIADEIDIE